MSDDSVLVRQLEALIIDNPQLDELENLIAEFNIFEAMRAVRQELRHSDFLAFMLNPAEKHNLGDLFLKRFLIRVLSDAADMPVSPIQISVTNLVNAVVEREAQNIDILIHDAGSGFVCIIENKIFSGEHSDQLNRYLDVVKRRFPSATAIIPVFLTPDGVSPGDDDSPYIPFGYGQIAELMEQTRQANESMLGPDVNTMIRHYVTMLRRHIVSDSDIAELCRKIYRNHKAAIDLIVEHMPDIRQELADYLEKLVSSEPSLDTIQSSKSRVIFALRDWHTIPEFQRGMGWAKSDATLVFDLSNRVNQLTLYLELGPVPEGHEFIREAIFACAYTNRDAFRGCRTKLSSQWTALYKLPLLRPKDYQDASIEDLARIIEPKWNRFVQDVLPRLNQHLMQIDFSR